MPKTSAPGIDPGPLPVALVEIAGAYRIVEKRRPREGEVVYVKSFDRGWFQLGVYLEGGIVAGGRIYDAGEALVQGVVIGEVTAAPLDGETATSPRQ